MVVRELIGYEVSVATPPHAREFGSRFDAKVCSGVIRVLIARLALPLDPNEPTLGV